MSDYKSLANHLYEAGHLKRTVRSGQRGLLTADYSDTVASHTYRVAIIAWHLGVLVEGVDPNKLAAMALFHDFEETRSGDGDWIMKRYVKVDSESIYAHQSEGLDNSFNKLVNEYENRETIESKLVKDADTLELLLTLKELEYKGNKEAINWLTGKQSEEKDEY